MKKQIYFLFVVIGILFIPFITVQAQYAIPSYDVELNQISATNNFGMFGNNQKVILNIKP